MSSCCAERLPRCSNLSSHIIPRARSGGAAARVGVREPHALNGPSRIGADPHFTRPAAESAPGSDATLQLASGAKSATARVSAGPRSPLEDMSISQAASPRSPTTTAIIGALGTLGVAGITLVTVFKVVDWSAAQTALVTAEAAAVTGLLTAIVAHLWPGTSKEPVALAATFTARCQRHWRSGRVSPGGLLPNSRRVLSSPSSPQCSASEARCLLASTSLPNPSQRTKWRGPCPPAAHRAAGGAPWGPRHRGRSDAGQRRWSSQHVITAPGPTKVVISSG